MLFTYILYEVKPGAYPVLNGNLPIVSRSFMKSILAVKKNLFDNVDSVVDELTVASQHEEKTA